MTLKICFTLYLLFIFLAFHPSKGRPHNQHSSQPPLNRSLHNLSNITDSEASTFNNASSEWGNVQNISKIRILSHGNLNRGGFVDEYSEQDIIFPDTYKVIFEAIPKIDGTPQCADNQPFCENVNSYPYLHIREVLKQQRIRNDLFGKDVLPEITNRLGTDDEDSYVCQSTQRTIFPKIGKNRNDEWKFIINQGDDDKYVQGVMVEMCKRRDGTPCDIVGELPNGYITSCKQKFIYRRLMSLSDSGDPIPDTFQLPSSCCCSYRQDPDFLSKFGQTSQTRK